MSVEGKMVGHLDKRLTNEAKGDNEVSNSLSMTPLLLPEAWLFDLSNHLSALLLSPDESLLITGLVLDGELLLRSVCGEEAACVALK